MNEPVRVAHLLHEELLTCSPEAPLHRVAAMMRTHRCSSVLVVDGERPVGIWTEHDTLRIDLADPEVVAQPVSRHMSSPVRTTTKQETIDEVGHRFHREGIRHLLVLDSRGGFAGIVSQTDVVLNYGLERYLQVRRVAEAQHHPLLTIETDLPLAAAAARIREAGVDAAVVSPGEDGLPGILTERDLVRQLALRDVARTAGEAATRPLITVDRECSLLQARDLSVRRGVRHLGITDAGQRIVGLLSFTDILGLLEHDQVSHLEQVLREREQALLASQRSLRLSQQVIDATLDGVIITNAEGIIEAVNPAFTKLTGYTAEEAVGKTPALLKSGRHDETFYEALWSGLHREGRWQGEIWNRRKNGEIYPEWLTITEVRDELGGEHKYAGVFSDISERKESEEKIRALAYYDALTGLPNRRLFQDRLGLALPQMRRHRQQLAVMFIDLDLFKRINDTLGHDVGDEVLVEMSRRLKACVRESDTVSRMGGDEFTILQPDIKDANNAAQLASRIIASLRDPFVHQDRELYVTSSVGIAMFPDDGETPDELTKNADTAMYRAKELGRNNYQLYTSAMSAASVERLAMENHLRHAIERGEFHLNFQVKVDVLSNRTTGVEALLRWENAELGPVSPADFIPLAEANGLILPIGEWVLREACRQACAWSERGLPEIHVAVNVSSRQLHQEDLCETVVAVLDETGFDPRRLELELTESMLMEHIEEVEPKLRRLRELGVRISIDDFGTGYSSLAYLKRLPIDTIKIDVSFIRDIPGDPDDSEIVAAIVAMAHRLDLQVVAEGVENEEQVRFLRALGCDQVQGYLVGRPLSADNIASLLDSNLLPEG
ncbi:MAG: EAL domain-containing protein [Gammaproteobacteria bacterium]|nr:EAL domain-containing protein [Gammaproteobacteria bacterium]